MDFAAYQSATDSTAIYPKAGTGDWTAINYAIVALAGESGELANKWKKFLRDGTPVEELYPVMIAELGDILWYMARLALEMGYSLDTVAQDNLAKLEFRRRRDALSGSGDNR